MTAIRRCIVVAVLLVVTFAAGLWLTTVLTPADTAMPAIDLQAEAETEASRQ